MADNGKNDQVEVVEGNITPKSTLIGLRVTKSTVTETSDGGARAVITVAGTKLVQQKLAGEQVNVITAGGRGGFGKCIEVTTKAGKAKGEKLYRMKLEGARELDSLVGLQVTISQAQGELPLGAEASTDEAAEEIRKLRPKGHDLAVNPPAEPHEKRGARKSADGGPWQGSPRKKGRGKGREVRA